MPKPSKPPVPKELKTKISFPVFAYTVHIIFSEDVVEARTRRNKLFKRDYDMGPAAGLHCVIEGDEDKSYLFLRYNTGINEVVHESCHAVQRIQRVTGADFCNETFAYHMGHLVQMITRFMNECDEKYCDILSK